MTDGLRTREELQLHESGQVESPSACNTDLEYAPMNEKDEMAITRIRVTDVALGLGRIPAGFYIMVHHSSQGWRTENKRSSIEDDAIEWDGPIPLPSDPLATICLGIYASFELQPVLGTGKQLRELTVTMEQLLGRSARAVPFSLLPKDDDVVSPCSSVSVTVNRQKHESGRSLLCADCPTTGSVEQLEQATNRGHSALSRYGMSREKQELESSIIEFELALELCPLGHHCRAAAQANLAMARFILCQVEDIDALLDIPLRLYRDALTARPPGHVDRPSTLIRLAVVHFARFAKQRDETERAQAVAILHEAVEFSSAESHRERKAAKYLLQLYARQVDPVRQDGYSSVRRDSAPRLANEDLSILSNRLLRRFKRYGDLADLHRVIEVLEELVKFTPVWDFRYLEALVDLGVALRYRFTHLGKLSDLEEAISRQRDTVELTPHGNPNKLVCLGNLGNSLVTRFEHLGQLSDLEEAISGQREVVDLTPCDHLDRPHRLCNLGNTLFLRFERLGDLHDLEHAISNYKDAVILTPDGHADKSSHLNSLGTSLNARFEHLGVLSDLEDAISVLREAVILTPHDHPYKPIAFTSLASSLKARFECLGQLSDLEEAISSDKAAVDLAPHSHPYKFMCLSNLGNSFLIRFQRLGELIDLEHAISTHRTAVTHTPHRHPERPARLANLGSSLVARFERLGELGDLEEAILALRDAIALTPNDHPVKPMRLSNLGSCLKTRFRRLGKLSDIEDAVSRHRDAVDLVPHGRSDKYIYLNNLGNAFRTRFEYLRELDDLRNAIVVLAEAVYLSPHGHFYKPGLLNNLANAFVTRFKQLGELNDLEYAISRYMDSVDLTPDGHPHKPSYLNNLGASFVVRFNCLGEPSDLKRAIFLYSRAALALTGPISVRFDASQGWVSCARHIRHHSIFQAYSVTVSLLPQLAWVGLSLTDRYSQLVQGADVVRDAAAAALDAGLPETAVEWLEQGRSVVWGELFRLRESHEELSSRYPKHARRLRELSIALEHVSATREKSLTSLSEEIQSAVPRMTESLQRDIDRQRTLAVQRDILLREIRGFPGFNDFLLHKTFSQLHTSAQAGPVVILNAAESRCDALVILANVDHVIHVPLPNFSFKLSADLQRTLQGLLGHARAAGCDERQGMPVTRSGASWTSLLSALWNGVVKPILDALVFSTPGDLPRIFWCPTGPFAFLPIHAAGLYDISHSQHGYKVFDFVVSSYTPTLSILALPSSPNTTPSRNLCLLAVRQPLSDGLPPLPGVNTELKHISAVIRKSSSACTTLLESSVGTVEEVLALMKVADWVHFACHGIQDAADSGLCLADGRRLKLRDIVGLSRPRGGLAFLSACQTATGDERLTEEAIHIAAGMLFAGYGGVIGTMWSISDKLAPQVARDVYEQLFRNATRPDCLQAARALYDAIRQLREEGASFAEWLPFIHVGL